MRALKPDGPKWEHPGHSRFVVGVQLLAVQEDAVDAGIHRHALKPQIDDCSFQFFAAS